jgi:hypothetical protein
MPRFRRELVVTRAARAVASVVPVDPWHPICNSFTPIARGLRMIRTIFALALLVAAIALAVDVVHTTHDHGTARQGIK